MSAPSPAPSLAPFRYRKLGYAALTVTDLERSVRFYRDLLGLDLVARTPEAAFLRCSRDPHNLALYAGAAPGLKRVGWELETQADVEKAYEHFQARGLEPRRVAKAEAQALRQGPGFRVRVPGLGLEFEYYGSTTVMARPYVPTVAKIARLGHVVVGSNDFAGAKQALLRDFGFVESDFVEDRFTFMRGFPNPFHHSFAVGASTTNHLHHVNFMVSDIDDVGRAWHRMTKAGVKIAFGIGRHPPSGSVFLYFFDPDGMTVEYSYGMEEFPEVGAREPRMLEPVPESLDTWGAVPDPEFGKRGVIEA
jgi:2,3-dihydroxy-p-cumate/2,3-dihydroxybenzoate 3,4-dioxygenase